MTEPRDLARPDLLIRHLHRELDGFDEPAVHLVRLDTTGVHECVACSTRLWDAPPEASGPDGTDLAVAALERLGMPGWDVPYWQRPLVVPVVVRPGRRLWTWDEEEVMLALRYAHNTTAFRQDELIVVTEQGWWCVLTGIREPEPRCLWSGATTRRLVVQGHPDE